MSNPSINSLESLETERKRLLCKMQGQRKDMNDKLHELFDRPILSSKTEKLMNTVSSGIAIYDGVMFGMKIVNRFRTVFSRKSRRK